MLRHVGIVVLDLPRAIDFWEKAGFSLFHGELPPDDYFEQRLGREERGPALDAALETRGISLRSVKMFDEDGQCIELLHFTSNHGTTLAHRAPRPYSPGITHIALTVPDIDEWQAKLTAAGAFFHAPPQRMSEKIRMVYCRGPEGILIELVEESPQNRLTPYKLLTS